MNFKVIRKHNSNYPNPIQFRVNDMFEIGAEDEEYPGWIWVRLSNGNEGWAPKEQIIINDKTMQGIAKSNYCARELDVKVGERLQIERILCGWYYASNSNGEMGWVPQECIQSA